MRSYAASPSQVLTKVRVPNMLPFFFTALKVASTLAFIGAIVGEYFGGNTKVIGKIGPGITQSWRERPGLGGHLHRRDRCDRHVSGGRAGGALRHPLAGGVSGWTSA